MADFLQQFKLCLPGRICLLGLGNVDSGDDGFGVRLAEALIRCGSPDHSRAANFKPSARASTA